MAKIATPSKFEHLWFDKVTKVKLDDNQACTIMSGSAFSAHRITKVGSRKKSDVADIQESD